MFTGLQKKARCCTKCAANSKALSGAASYGSTIVCPFLPTFLSFNHSPLAPQGVTLDMSTQRGWCCLENSFSTMKKMLVLIHRCQRENALRICFELSPLLSRLQSSQLQVGWILEQVGTPVTSSVASWCCVNESFVSPAFVCMVHVSVLWVQPLQILPAIECTQTLVISSSWCNGCSVLMARSVRNKWLIK